MPSSFLAVPRVGAGAGSVLSPGAAASASPAGRGGASEASFGDTLESFLNQVDGSQRHADQLVERFALGEPVEVHQVLSALGEAETAVQLTVTLRNKILDAYQEIMRTQI